MKIASIVFSIQLIGKRDQQSFSVLSNLTLALLHSTNGSLKFKHALLCSSLTWTDIIHIFLS
jgi:hypothetical protein